MTTGNEAERQLASSMAKYSGEIVSLAREIRARMRAKYPTALELAYDNYNALAIGYGPTEKASEAIFSIALYPRWINLFFLQAKGLPDPNQILKGSGTVARHVTLPSADALDHPFVHALMDEAVTRAKVPFPSSGTHRLIIKSISENQRPRRPAKSPRPAAARSSNKRAAR